MGAGSAYEGTYVYAGSRPIFMTDLSGLRGAAPRFGSRGGSRSIIRFLDNPIVSNAPLAQPRNGQQQTLFGGTCFAWQKNCESYRKKIGRAVKKAVTSVKGRSREDVVDAGQTYVETLSTYAEGTLGGEAADAVGKLSTAKEIFENCTSDEKSSPRCLKDLTLAAVEIFPINSAGMILGGPANVALYNLIIGLTDYVNGNLNSATTGLSGSCSSEITKVGTSGSNVETVTCADGKFSRRADGSAWSVAGKIG